MIPVRYLRWMTRGMWYKIYKIISKRVWQRCFIWQNTRTDDRNPFWKTRNQGHWVNCYRAGGVQRDGATRRGHATATGRWATPVSWRHRKKKRVGWSTGNILQEMGSNFLEVDGYLIWFWLDFAECLLIICLFAIVIYLPCVDNLFGNVFWPFRANLRTCLHNTKIYQDSSLKARCWDAVAFFMGCF